MSEYKPEEWLFGRKIVEVYVNKTVEQTEDFIIGVMQDYLTEQGYHEKWEINGANIKAAIEKQIPKRIWGNEHNPVHIGDTVNGLCPICNTEFVCITPRLYKQKGYGYCKQCGQKLDWSE